MKPHSLKPTSQESGLALKRENDYLKTKLGEYIKTINTQNKNIEGLRTKNMEFVKSNEANTAIIKNLTTRVTELSRDCLKAMSRCTKLERKLREAYTAYLEVQNTFVNGSNNLLKLRKIFETDTEGDLTLGRESSGTALNSTLSTSSKSNMKVLPMMGGHTIQKPTITIRKSDSQQINLLIQHQNENRNDSSDQDSANSSSNSLNSSNEIPDNDVPDNMENGDENYEEIEDLPTGRLSTILEITNSTSITNSINVISNIVMSGSDASANNTTIGENSLLTSKKRPSKMPSPIDLPEKMPRGKSNLSKSRHFGNHSSMQMSVSSIGMSTKGNSTTFQSDTISEDPLEGPSILLDSTNKSSSTITELKKSEEGGQDKPMSTSTPMDKVKRKRKKSSNIIEPFVNHVTLRKPNSNAKESNANAIENTVVEETNLSKSSSDLSDTTIIELPTKTDNAKKLKILNRPSTRSKSPEVQNISIPVIDDADNSEDESSPVKIPRKRGRPKKSDVKIVKKPTINKRRTRRSRSHSPSVENNLNPPEFDLRIGNPIGQLVGFADHKHNILNRRRSRSVSPAATLTGSDRSDGTEASTRSSRRARAVVNYNEQSLKLKLRRK